MSRSNSTSTWTFPTWSRRRAYAESLGARRVEGAGQEGNFIVLIDPSGHPFCVCR